MVHNFHRAIELLFPSYAIKKYCRNGIFRINYYNVIVSSSLSAFPIALADLNHDAGLWLYEDGSGSYYGELY